jgi:hypothetical protein
MVFPVGVNPKAPGLTLPGDRRDRDPPHDLVSGGADQDDTAGDVKDVGGLRAHGDRDRRWPRTAAGRNALECGVSRGPDGEHPDGLPEEVDVSHIGGLPVRRDRDRVQPAVGPVTDERDRLERGVGGGPDRGHGFGGIVHGVQGFPVWGSARARPELPRTGRS